MVVMLSTNSLHLALTLVYVDGLPSGLMLMLLFLLHMLLLSVVDNLAFRFVMLLRMMLSL